MSFGGREHELEQLLAAWEKLQTGDAPQVAVLLADSGMGKTRLIQEFFAEIGASVRSEDGRGYWPRTLGEENGSLLVNPRFEDVDEGVGMPYLWWGLRLVNPKERNHVMSAAVGNYLPVLTPHLHVMQKAKRAREAWLKAGGVALKFGLSFIPMAGAVAENTQTFLDLFQAGRQIFKSDDADLATLEAKTRTDTNDSVFNVMAELVRTRDGGASVPIVWVIDDAHFASHDPGLVDLFNRILGAAVAGGWPMMIIATHWLMEWHQAKAVGGATGVAAAIENHWQSKRPRWQPIQLEPLSPPHLEPFIKERLPGLTAKQRNAILRRAGGHPGVLAEIVRVCSLKRSRFVDKNTAGPLTERGLEEVLNLPSDFSRLAEERLADLPENVAKLVSLASIQGYRFLHRLNQRMAERLSDALGEASEVVSAECFDLALNPYAVFQLEDRKLARYTQRVLLDAARSRLEDVLDADEEEILEAWREVLEEAATEKEATWTSEERRLIDEMLVDSMASSQKPHQRQLAAEALLRLLAYALEQGDANTARILGEEILAGVEEDRWEAEAIGFDALRRVFVVLRAGQALPAAKSVAEMLFGIATGDEERYEALNALGDVAYSLRDMPGAEESWRSAFGIAQQLADASPSDQWRRYLAWAHFRLGRLAQQTDDIDLQLLSFSQAARLLDEIVGPGAVLADIAAAARFHGFVGSAHLKREEPDLALDAFRRSLTLNEARHSAAPSMESQTGLSINYGWMGDAWEQKGDVQAAVDCYQRALSINEAMLKQLPTIAAESGLCFSLGRLGRLLVKEGQFERGLELHQRALRVREDQLAALGTVEIRVGLAWALGDFALANSRVGHLEAALTAYDRALSEWDTVVAQSSSRSVAQRKRRDEVRAEAIQCLELLNQRNPTLASDEPWSQFRDRWRAADDSV